MGLPHASTTYYAHPPFARVCMIVRSWMINPLNVSDHLPVAARLRMSPTVARPHRIPRGEPDRPNWKHCSRKQLPQCSESLIAWHPPIMEPFHNWHNGRPSIPSDRFRQQYKAAKRIFSRAFRKFGRQEFDRFLDDLELDDRRLFHQLRVRNGSSSLPTSSITFNGQSFGDRVGPKNLRHWLLQSLMMLLPQIHVLVMTSFHQPSLEFYSHLSVNRSC